MDLNYLLHRHQVSLFRADAAEDMGAKRSHTGLAMLYERAIAALHARPAPLIRTPLLDPAGQVGAAQAE